MIKRIHGNYAKAVREIADSDSTELQLRRRRRPRGQLNTTRALKRTEKKNKRREH